MMRSAPHSIRIGLCPLPGEPFWIQVEAAIQRRAKRLPVELVHLGRDDGLSLGARDGSARGGDELLALEPVAVPGCPAGPDCRPSRRPGSPGGDCSRRHDDGVNISPLFVVPCEGYK